ncbi:MAG: hypothetical protein ACRD19_11290, partial [Terriglobia bacterium]
MEHSPQSDGQRDAGENVLDDPARTWRVSSGFVDVFLIERDGPRRHLFCVTSGGVLIGFGRFPDDRFQVKTFPSPEARLEDGPATPELQAEAIDAWIDTVTRSLGVVRSRRVAMLAADAPTPIDKRPVSSANGILWAAPLTGQASFLGDASLPAIDEGSFFPVSPAGWLEPLESTQFAARDTEAQRRSGELMPALLHFNSCVLMRWRARALDEEARHSARAVRQREAAGTRMSEALLALASALNKNKRSSGSSAGDPWIACCRMIGEEEYIDFVVPTGGVYTAQENPSEAIARASGVRTRKVLLAAGWWKTDHGALLGRMRESRAPVAFLPRGSGYRCFNPQNGDTYAVN